MQWKLNENYIQARGRSMTKHDFSCTQLMMITVWREIGDFFEGTNEHSFSPQTLNNTLFYATLMSRIVDIHNTVTYKINSYGSVFFDGKF